MLLNFLCGKETSEKRPVLVITCGCFFGFKNALLYLSSHCSLHSHILDLQKQEVRDARQEYNINIGSFISLKKHQKILLLPILCAHRLGFQPQVKKAFSFRPTHYVRTYVHTAKKAVIWPFNLERGLAISLYN